MRHAVLIAILLAVASQAPAVEPSTYLVPVAAFNLPGRGENLWSSELYAVNTGDEPGRIEVVGFLPGAIEPLQTFAPCSEPVWTLPVGVPVVLPRGLQLCASAFVGAVLLEVEGTIQLRVRMVNHREVLAPEDQTGTPIPGLGQDIPVYPLGTVVPGTSSSTLTLWPLLWHRNTCGAPPGFESYLGVANFGDDWGQIRVGSPDEAASVIVDGHEVPFGDLIDVPPRSWHQYRLQPGDLPTDDCRAPESVSLEVEVEGSLSLYGSVVDRLSQDPRTVPATAPPTGAVRPQ